MRGEKQKANLLVTSFKTITIIVVLGLFLWPLSPSFLKTQAASTSNNKLNDLFQQKSQLNQEINSKSKQVDKKKQEASALNTALRKIDDNIKATENKIQELQNQIEQTQKEIEVTEQQISQKQAELDEAKDQQAETIRLIYEQNQGNTLYLLVGSRTLSEAIDKVQYFETLENRITQTIEEISRLKKELEEKKAALGQKKVDLARMKNEQEAYRQGLGQQQKEKETVLADVNTQKKQLEVQIEEAKKLTNQVEAQITQIQAQLKNNSSRTVMARDRGTSTIGFQWPINYNYLSAYFGDRTPFQVSHTGLDIVNIPGTPIHAAASGTVVAVADMMYDGHYYGYGKYVVIGHNARYSSLYAHLMAFNVAVGQEVKAGEVIGYLGSTGWSTGPHLHFEIWDYGNRQNPLGYLP